MAGGKAIVAFIEVATTLMHPNSSRPLQPAS
jgi:hypothetical protein